ncbi:hypothetical protein B566_EDAN004005 [Ephemera danica]|nr:hypothetical protein B566_EDAN004005 [Ephemera danica]
MTTTALLGWGEALAGVGARSRAPLYVPPDVPSTATPLLLLYGSKVSAAAAASSQVEHGCSTDCWAPFMPRLTQKCWAGIVFTRCRSFDIPSEFSQCKYKHSYNQRGRAGSLDILTPGMHSTRADLCTALPSINADPGAKRRRYHKPVQITFTDDDAASSGGLRSATRLSQCFRLDYTQLETQALDGLQGDPGGGRYSSSGPMSLDSAQLRATTPVGDERITDLDAALRRLEEERHVVAMKRVFSEVRASTERDLGKLRAEIAGSTQDVGAACSNLASNMRQSSRTDVS